jgi:predicted nucleotidyltransferase
MVAMSIKTKPLPVGTHIVVTVTIKEGQKEVVKKGSVGQVVEHVGDKFLVKFPHGSSRLFCRSELVPRRDSLRELHLKQEVKYDTIKRLIVFECVRGSTAYGLTVEGSDVDKAGIFVLPPHLVWGLREYKDNVQNQSADDTYHEIAKLIRLACQGNPNIIEMGEISRMPELVTISPENELIQELFDRWSELFVSKYVFRAYQGYAIAEFKSLEKQLKNQGNIRWKHACHLLRLLWSGIECMTNGRIVVRPPDPIREKLLEVRRGEWSLDQFKKWRLELQDKFQKAFDKAELPKRAKFDAASDLLIRIRQHYYDEGLTFSEQFGQ